MSSFEKECGQVDCVWTGESGQLEFKARAIQIRNMMVPICSRAGN